MRTVQPSIAGLLRSDAQGKILATVLLQDSTSALSVTDIAVVCAVPLPTVSREIDRLVISEILTDRRIGRSRLVMPNLDNPVTRPLTEIILLTYGPLPILTRALVGHEGISEAYIYGSWAERMNNVAGPFPRDIDVLLVGSISKLDALAVTEVAEEALRRPVNPTVVDAARWSSDDPFVTTVRSRPLVPINLDGR